MTVAELVGLATDWVEDDKITDRVRLYFINQIEGMIQTELLQTDPNEIRKYTADDLSGSTELLVSDPHTDVYVTWMVAMAYWYAGEYDIYQNEKAMFDAAWYRLAAMIAERDHGGSNERRPGYDRH